MSIVSKKETVFYSTGPIENTKSNGQPGASNNVIVKVLNNDKKQKAFVEVKVFRLNGKKHLIGSTKFTVGPRKSTFRVGNMIGNAFQYEVQIKVTGDVDDVLLAVFGRKNGKINPSQRVLNSELTKIDHDSWKN